MQDDIPMEQLVKKGTMTKSPFKMTPEELKIWKEECQIEARAYLFSIGQPLVYGKDGHLVAEFADGRIEILRE